MKITYPPILSPILFVTFNLLNLFGTANVHKVFLSEFVVPWLAVSALAAGIYLLMVWRLKDQARAEILSFTITVLLSAYGHVHIYLAEQVVGRPIHAVLLPVWAVLLALSIYSMVRREKGFDTWVVFVRVTVGILLLMSLAGVVKPVLGGLPNTQVELDSPDAADIAAQATPGEPLPDVYYIILDQYTRADILQEYYGYDNTGFVEALEERGFYVAEQSRSNYLMTSFSLASSLNMQQITFLTGEVEPGSFGVILPFHMIRNNKVMTTLDAMGYTTIHLSSGWEGTRSNPNADLNYRYKGLSGHSFGGLVMNTSILNPVYETLADNEARHRTLYNFDTLGEIAANPEPTFTFAHMIVPHVPYVFDRQGNPANPTSDEQGYLDQLIYTNTLVLDAVDAILAASDTPPIIVVQGDHGTLSTGGLVPEDVTDRLLHERSAILNAYYFPSGDYGQLYPDITPVNSFRVIFNSQFGTSLSLVDDTTYASTYSFPYAFGVLPESAR